jgi:leucyl-tRNA synthetase
LLLLLSPMTPHLTAELWEERYPGEPSVHLRPWPLADPALVKEETVTMIVQVNGKVRARIEVAPSITEAEAQALALAHEKVQRSLDGQATMRVVVKPPRLVNIIL